MRTDTPAATQQYRPTTDPTSIDATTTTDEAAETATRETPFDTEEPDSADPTEDAASWVARCQRSFDSTATDRLTNTADDANQAMPSGK
ncbi:hypothetical protein [Haloarchaeobius sp. DYHT-AS-18]|uniref:hypothetical protein n=1 Tax=Haloarchaeobius sp. DYHT-AS-18 TaxID=3446117 RepID=UPI003EBC1FDB